MGGMTVEYARQTGAQSAVQKHVPSLVELKGSDVSMDLARSVWPRIQGISYPSHVATVSE